MSINLDAIWANMPSADRAVLLGPDAPDVLGDDDRSVLAAKIAALRAEQSAPKKAAAKSGRRRR